jgi:hypothetical protein
MTSDAKFRPLIVRDDPHWIDLQLWVTRHDRIEFEGQPCVRIGAGARHDERDLGFIMLYPLRWENNPEHGSFALSSIVYLMEAKPYSDAFLHTLARLWRVDPPARMAPASALGAYGYAGTPQRVLDEPVTLFVVVGEAPEPGKTANPAKPYGQMHLTVDIPGGKITFAEREPDYPEFRRAIVRALSGSG